MTGSTRTPGESESDDGSRASDFSSEFSDHPGGGGEQEASAVQHGGFTIRGSPVNAVRKYCLH